MSRRLFLQVPLWPHWIMLVLSLLLAAEYARLVLTTDTAAYRDYVLIAWILLSIFWLVRVVRTYRINRKRMR